MWEVRRTERKTTSVVSVVWSKVFRPDMSFMQKELAPFSKREEKEMRRELIDAIGFTTLIVFGLLWVLVLVYMDKE